MPDTITHDVKIIWKRRPLRSEAHMEKGRLAALKALEEGKTSLEAAHALVKAMYGGKEPVFDGFVVMIDGESFE